MGIEITEIGADRTSGTMPVAGNTQPAGLLHGGASAVLAESLGSIAASVHAGPGRAAVGIEINATHHRAMREGVVTGVATAVHLGRSVVTYEIVISDERGRRVCTCAADLHARRRADQLTAPEPSSARAGVEPRSGCHEQRRVWCRASRRWR